MEVTYATQPNSCNSCNPAFCFFIQPFVTALGSNCPGAKLIRGKIAKGPICAELTVRTCFSIHRKIIQWAE